VAELVGRLEETSRQRWQALEATRARGLAHLLAGDLDKAVADLEAVTESVRAAEILEPGAFPASPGLVEALARLGRPEDAARELAWLEERSREQDHPWGLAVSARARGLLHEQAGELADAEASLRESLERHADLELPLDEARARLALGRVLRRDGRRREARELLSDAAERLGALGVEPLAAAARAELASVGGRAVSEQGLTPAEERVARLVAEGLTNQEVATRLVVTVRAVEANLTRVYAKLGVRSRTQLARIFAADL
jgi:DNA-binding CsgD family transcriptional regulator